MVGAIYSNWLEWLPDQLDGLFVSVQLTAAILATGLPLGVLLALGVASPAKPIRWAALVVVELGRGTPAFVILLLVYYGLPQVDVLIPAFACGVIAFGLAMGAYTSEVFRAAFGAVGKVQREAADAVGLTGFDAFRYVTLPQALRIATPALMGWAILFFQATSLCFTIAVPELMTTAYNQGSVTLDFIGAFALAGTLYASISIPASYLVSRLERRLDQQGQGARPRSRRWLRGARTPAPSEG
ncbi:MAG: amino acid ABC transporter permease [Solirubrobacterales bacterium]|nr:amino acid ABC transporter permease [Solirubrobacterales bacterium]